jgi:hypothetical protein
VFLFNILGGSAGASSGLAASFAGSKEVPAALGFGQQIRPIVIVGWEDVSHARGNFNAVPRQSAYLGWIVGEQADLADAQ